MNTVEKAYLTRELKQLLYDLDHRALTMFETARSKQRIKDIFELCDQPVFHKQILEFRALTQPDLAAAQYVAQTVYQLSYRGFFYHDYDLEQVLYQFPEYGWAMLYRPRQGWQMWLIPAKYKTALLSEWGPIQSSYAWLEEQISEYHCLETDEILKVQAAQLQSTTLSRNKANRPQKPNNLAAEHETANNIITEDIPVAEVKPIKQLAHFKLQQQQFYLSEATLPPELKLTAYELNPTATHHRDYLAIYLNTEHATDLTTQPVFLAEQLNVQGSLAQYLLLLGFSTAEDLLAQLEFFEQHGLELASIHICALEQLQQCWQSVEQLFNYYQSLSPALWQRSDYLPFIPQQLIQSQKIIHFDEARARPNTPILLLQERDKLRMIHGQNRIYLNTYELALPYLYLNREDGFNWQTIKHVISELESPIEVYGLYQALLDTQRE